MAAVEAAVVGGRCYRRLRVLHGRSRDWDTWTSAIIRSQVGCAGGHCSTWCHLLYVYQSGQRMLFHGMWLQMHVKATPQAVAAAGAAAVNPPQVPFLHPLATSQTSLSWM